MARRGSAASSGRRAACEESKKDEIEAGTPQQIGAGHLEGSEKLGHLLPRDPTPVSPKDPLDSLDETGPITVSG